MNTYSFFNQRTGAGDNKCCIKKKVNEVSWDSGRQESRDRCSLQERDWKWVMRGFQMRPGIQECARRGSWLHLNLRASVRKHKACRGTGPAQKQGTLPQE